MQKHRRILTIIGFFSVLVMFNSCLSVPDTKPSEIGKDKEKDKMEETIVVKQKKRMNKKEFALLIQSLLEKKDYDTAISFFDNTDEVDEKVLQDVSTKVLKVSILISAGRGKAALAFLEKLEKEYPDDVELLYCRVMIAQSSGDEKAKAEYLNKILKLYPNDSWAMTEQGLDFYSKKNYKGAKTKFLSVLKHSPKNVDALLGLARVNYMENKLKDAEANLNMALETDRENSILWAEMARIKSETNRMLAAIKDIKKAIELDKDIPSHWMDLGFYTMQMGKKKDAKEAFSRVIEIDPSAYTAFIYRAGINDELGFYDEAMKDYYKIISLYPSYYFAFEGAGILHIKNEEWEKGVYCFSNALKKAPTQYHYAILTAFCLYKTKKEKQAKDLIREYLKNINREKNEEEYFLTRLFSERTGDADVHNRIMKIKDKTKHYRMSFYLGAFYEVIKKNTLAEKYYIDVLSAKVPSFIEYRLAKIALERIRG